jgi:hypothetical protein
MTLMPLRNDAQRRPRYLLQPSVTLVKPARIIGRRSCAKLLFFAPPRTA